MKCTVGTINIGKCPTLWRSVLQVERLIWISLLELSALSYGTAPAHAPTPSRTFPSSTSVNHTAGYDKLPRGFVKAFLSFYQSNSCFYCLCFKSTGCSPICILLFAGKWSVWDPPIAAGQRLPPATAIVTAKCRASPVPPARSYPDRWPQQPHPLLLGHGEQNGPQLGPVTPYR